MQLEHVDVRGEVCYNIEGGDIVPLSEARKRANIEYNRRQDSITIRPSKERGAEIRAAAAAEGLSVQAYILHALEEYERRKSTKGEKLDSE